MTRPSSIRTTIPPRTYGAGRKSQTPSAMLLRMSFLELERQRRVLETTQLQARSVALQVRIEQIDREKAALRQSLDGVVEPTVASASGVAPPRPTPRTRPRGGFAIRY
jgi:hypothetical protein